MIFDAISEPPEVCEVGGTLLKGDITNQVTDTAASKDDCFVKCLLNESCDGFTYFTTLNSNNCVIYTGPNLKHEVISAFATASCLNSTTTT